jgi:hypothetical protein
MYEKLPSNYVVSYDTTMHNTKLKLVKKYNYYIVNSWILYRKSVDVNMSLLNFKGLIVWSYKKQIKEVENLIM